MKETSSALQPAPLPSATRWAILSAVFTLPGAVDAAIVYSGIQNISTSLATIQRHASNGVTGSANTHRFIDLDGNAVNDFDLRVRQNRLANGFAIGTAKMVGLAGGLVAGGEGGGVFNLRTSNVVPIPSQYNASLLRGVRTINDANTLVYGAFGAGVPGIAGVQFFQAGQLHYGWVRLQVDDGPSGFPYKLTAIDWAYESAPNTPIHIENPVPEASPGMVLLAAGGTGLAAWRLRRRKTADVAGEA
jgi:hypothetical protein